MLPITLIAFAFALRLWGITWGLPDQRKLFSYHPDEGVNLVQGVLDRGAVRPHLDLAFYNYGTLYFYAWQAAVEIDHVIFPPKSDSAGGDESPAGLILTGRILTATLGALTVWPVFSLARRLFGHTAGLLSGFAYAIIPVAVVHAHFGTVDIPATFCVAMALAVGARLLDQVRHRDVVMAGLWCGLAAATKYNTGLVIAAPVVALFSSHRPERPATWKSFLLLFGSAAVTFLIACPGPILNPGLFWDNVSFELHKSGQGMGLLFANTAPGWIYHLTVSLRFALGIPMLLLALMGVCWAVVRRTPQDLYLLAFVTLYYLVIGAAQVKFMRYVIPLLPAFAVLSGRLVAESWRARPWIRNGVFGLSMAAGLITLVIALSLDNVMTMRDPRDRAADEIASDIPKGSVLAFARTPWYDSPPLAPEFTAPSPAVRREAAHQISSYTVRLPEEGKELDLHVLDPPLPDVVILSDLATEDWQRLGLADWMIFKSILDKNYNKWEFENLPGMDGLNLGKPDYVPNDLLYIYPRITVYTREKGLRPKRD